jgi:hypothetical protein
MEKKTTFERRAYSVGETAAMLGVSLATVWRRIGDDTLKDPQNGTPDACVGSEH